MPYQVFAASDGHLVIACGNDRQFKALCQTLDLECLAEIAEYATNPSRVVNRDALVVRLSIGTARHSRAFLIEKLETAGAPAGPINTVA